MYVRRKKFKVQLQDILQGEIGFCIMQVLPPMIISPYTKEITMYAVFYYSLELFITLGHFSQKVERMENIHWKKRIKVHSCLSA